MPDVPARILEELHAVPLRAFTRERDARAAALAKAGDADTARVVKRLRRPAAALWAVNQLARAEPKRLAAFLDAVGQARAAQLRDPRVAAEAVRRQRTELEALVQRAGLLLSDQGSRPTPATTRRIADTLLGVAADRRLADDVRHGRLASEVTAPGFEVLTGVPAGRPPRVDRADRGTGEQADSARRAKIRAAEEERQPRREHVEALEFDAAARAAEVQQKERAVSAAAAALAAARRELREAQRQARAASAAARKGRAALGRQRRPVLE
jgi:hypothetical protein